MKRNGASNVNNEDAQRDEDDKDGAIGTMVRKRDRWIEKYESRRRDVNK